MVRPRFAARLLSLVVALLCLAFSVQAQEAGGIRGVVYDKDFEAPLAEARVQVVETGDNVSTSEEGAFLIGNLKAGTYTLVFSKDGYTRQLRGDVVVSAGRITEVSPYLTGDFTDMEEFIVEDIQIGGATEIGLLELRIESAALMDSISAELLSQSGAGDAAAALNLVAGATVSDGKYAVIRGLPDRYVNSQLNGVRLPTADADKRAVQLDQFPASMIESVQVSKTFTPDQQGDASGGAVNVVLKGVPDETVLQVSGGLGWNTQSGGTKDFMTSRGGGTGFLGMEEDRDELPDGSDTDVEVGVARDDAPLEYKWGLDAGTKYVFENGWTLGGLATLFYERDVSYYGEGVDDKYWVESPGGEMTPQTGQGAPRQGDFKTSLFDVTQGSEEVKWGGIASLGFETERNALTLLYMYTRVAEDVATLAEDTRGKAYYFPGYDVDDPQDPGNRQRDAAPYLRMETLSYTERVMQSLQLSGRHTIPIPELKLFDFFEFLEPVVEWGVSKNSAWQYQPDKRQFGSIWWAESYSPGYPPYVPPSYLDPLHLPYKPAANFTMGNLQRVWKEILEESEQARVDLKLPFLQWTGTEGYFKFGVFQDAVTRTYEQDSFSNFNDNTARYVGDWEDFWSEAFPEEEHLISAAEIDVDYEGFQDISAWYWMTDVPLTSWFKIIGGMRYETTELEIVNTPEDDVAWFPPGSAGSVELRPGDADVAYLQEDVLPSIGFVFEPFEQTTLRGTYTETVARQTFKELTPIQQQEFLGGDVFIGNPALTMSALKNYDLRFDYRPFAGSLVSFSAFWKEILNPIEYVQRIADFPYTTAVNYPEGDLSGYEMELRQNLGSLWDPLEGLSIGGNATLIESEVTLPEEESAQFDALNIQAPMKTRDMTNAPEHLYNIFMTYAMDRVGLKGTELGVFYTVRGDTLVAGAGQSKGKFVPSVYETEYGTLNLSLSQKIGETWKIGFKAKNLLDPDIQSVYRSEYIEKDVVKTSRKKGIDFSLSVGGRF